MRIDSLILVSILMLSGVTACSSDQSSQEPQQQLIMRDGVVNIRVLPGSLITDDCGINPEDLEASEYGCVVFPFASKNVEGKNWDAEYLNALSEDGWKFSGGEGNAYYLEKPATSECSYSLAMIGWLQGTKDQVEQYFTTGKLGEIVNQTYIFAVDDEQKCGDKRNVK